MQTPQTSVRVTILIIFSLLCVGNSQPAQAQISADRLQQLKQKYGEWGSIYLSYGTIPDIIQVLENRNRLEFIRMKFKVTPPAELVSFFYVTKSPSQRTSVTMFQINFETKVAGYLMNSNHNGTITRVAMGPSEVLRAADWCDQYLTHRQEIFRIAALLEQNQAPLPKVWNAILAAHSNPFITEGSIVSLLTHYRIAMKARAEEVEALRTKSPKLHETLINFSIRFDDTARIYLFNHLLKEGYPFPNRVNDDPARTSITTNEEWGKLLDSRLNNYVLPSLKLEAEQAVWDLSPPGLINNLKLEIYRDFERFVRPAHWGDARRR